MNPEETDKPYFKKRILARIIGNQDNQYPILREMLKETENKNEN